MDRTGAAFTLTVNGYTGHAYQLQRSGSLADAFSSLGSPRTGAGGSALTFTDNDSSAA